jgi:hypothetical protein
MQKTIDLGEYKIKIVYNELTGDLNVSVFDELNEIIESINIENIEDDEFEESEDDENNEIDFNLN